MIDSVLIFFAKNCLSISILLWCLSMLGNIFFSKIEYPEKQEFYECGFKTTTDVGFSLNFSFFISAIFLILYDVELIILIPFVFNYELLSLSSIILYIYFVSIVYLTFVLDSWFEAVEWVF